MPPVSLLVVLLAMLIMLGVPKGHKGLHGAHRHTGLQNPQSYWCKRLLTDVLGFHESHHHTPRHSHNKAHKCNQILLSKYNKCCYIICVKEITALQICNSVTELFSFSYRLYNTFKCWFGPWTGLQSKMLKCAIFSYMPFEGLEVCFWRRWFHSCVYSARSCLFPLHLCHHSQGNVSLWLSLGLSDQGRMGERKTEQRESSRSESSALCNCMNTLLQAGEEVECK